MNAPAAAHGRLLMVERPGDLETTIAARRKLRHLAGPSFLLESVEGGAARGRYSMIGVMPDRLWRVQDGVAALAHDPLAATPTFAPVAMPPLEHLRQLIAESALPLPEACPPMAAGLFGFLGYDMVRHMERLPGPRPDPIGLPEAMLLRPSVMVIFDHVKDVILVAAPVRDGKAAAAAERLRQVTDALDGPLPADTPRILAESERPIVSNTPAERYLAMVAAAKEAILAGDIFQVVLSQRFTTPFPLDSLELYRALRRVNPAPFLGHLDFGSFALVCSSPEILVRLRAGTVTIRAIAGTRPRGRNAEEDRRLEEELLADPKERAEHLMLLDLARNDVGRVAAIGSVRVTERFVVERYSHVLHIVSQVEGDLAPGRDAVDALVAGFPAGTVSGAPKVRAMEIIEALETDRRGAYAGAIGYFGANGDMDTCIALRTAIVKDGLMHVQAGAGIVHDSRPESEAAECAAKARALFRAAEEALAPARRPARA